MQGTQKAKTPEQGIDKNERKQRPIIRGPHENVNGRLKMFNALNVSFHHTEGRDRDRMIGKHGMCFGAVAVITQLKLEHREGMYNAKFSDTHNSTSW